MKKSKFTKKGLKRSKEQRYFSEAFRQARVKEYEEGQVSVIEICRAYKVSKNAVYKWIRKYSTLYEKRITKVVEEKSETKKRLRLEKQVNELEQLIGQQQVKIEYYKKLVDLIEQHYQIDFEKNSDWKSWNGSSSTDPNTL